MTGAAAGGSGERPRRVDFDGPRNFRDLGGYPAGDGHATRWGVLYRADRLDRMTDADLERFAELGIARVYDLRHGYERDRYPDPVPSVHVPVMSKVMAAGPRPDIAALVDHDDGRAFMRDMMLRLLEHAAPELGELITAFADPDDLPVVFHCSAGKDRTGVVAALVLETLGVDREIVIDDFALTGEYRADGEDSAGFAMMLQHGFAPEVAAGALGAPRSMMSELLDEIDRRWGGAERYLAERAGLRPATIDALRSTLVGRC